MTEQVGAVDLVTDFLGDRGDMDREVDRFHPTNIGLQTFSQDYILSTSVQL